MSYFGKTCAIKQLFYMDSYCSHNNLVIQEAGKRGEKDFHGMQGRYARLP